MSAFAISTRVLQGQRDIGHAESDQIFRENTLVRAAKPSREKGMKSIRLKITIHLNGNHALSIRRLNALKPLVEKSVAAALPGSLSFDTIRVTKVKEMKIPEDEGARSEALSP